MNCLACQCPVSNEKELIKCTFCRGSYHYACVGLSAVQYIDNIVKLNRSWHCPTCMNITTRRKEPNTPVRCHQDTAYDVDFGLDMSCESLDVTRNNANLMEVAAPAGSDSASHLGTSPAPPTMQEVETVIQNVIQREIKKLMGDLQNTFSLLLVSQLKSIKEELHGVKVYMNEVNVRYESLAEEHKQTHKNLESVKEEGESMKKAISDLQSKVSQLEQGSRRANIEIQCMPESEGENIHNIVSKIGKAVNFQLPEDSLLRCSRIAKRNTESERPRAIVAQFTGITCRDQFLKAIVKYNKEHRDNKLNTEHIGWSGQKQAIFVVDHLTAENKDLHAKTRKLAKEKGYQFTWVKAGKIFARKTEKSDIIYIKNKDSLSNIV